MDFLSGRAPLPHRREQARVNMPSIAEMQAQMDLLDVEADEESPPSPADEAPLVSLR